jgi:hypothetical protein
VGDEGARGEDADVYDALSDESANKRNAMHKTDSASDAINSQSEHNCAEGRKSAQIFEPLLSPFRCASGE